MNSPLKTSADAPPARWALPWPLPAALAWAGGWAAWWGLGRTLPPVAAFGAALLLATALASSCSGRRRWRQGIAALGFPLSAWALGVAAALPPWVWLLLLLPVLAVYPLRAWRDAPLFPTPPDALAGLAAVVGTPQRVLDAGCGLGHGLLALRRQWPQAQLHGVEWSPLLAALTALRLRGSRGCRIRRGDMWAGSWAGYDLVYLFQRPESMARAFAKAAAEMAPTAWLVSLEFPVPGQAAVACLQGPARRTVWIYRPVTALQRSTGAGPGR